MTHVRCVSILGGFLLVFILGVTCIPSAIIVDPCGSDADCDDDNPCTDDACIEGGLCANTPNLGPCDDGMFCNGDDFCGDDGAWVSDGNPCVDDGFFCNGTEGCNEETDSCESSGDPCRGRGICDEQYDHCIGIRLCSDVSQCGDDNSCTDDACADGVCLNAVNCELCPDLLECGGSPCDEPDEPDEPAPQCTSSANCDDGVFCNGYDYCDGCVYRVGARPCSQSYRQLWLCDEDHDRCYQCESDGDCALEHSCTEGLCTGFCDGVDCRSENLCDRRHCVGESLCIRDPIYCDPGLRCHPPTGTCVSVGETCLSQCQDDVRECCALDSPGCVERPLSDFADYDTVLTRWRLEYDRFCNLEIVTFPWMVTGTCPDGTRVLQRQEYLGALHTSFFDAASGAFRAVMTDTWSEPVFPEKCRGRAYWPELPTCEAMTVTEVLCGEPCVVVGDIVYFDPCRIPFSGGPCASPYFLDSLAGFAATREKWKAEPGCTSGYDEVFAGACSEGTVFLWRPSLISVIVFYDAGAGRFLATMQQSDVGDIACCGASYWPAPMICTNPTITEILCETSFFADHVRIPSTDSCIASDP